MVKSYLLLFGLELSLNLALDSSGELFSISFFFLNSTLSES